MKPPAFHPEAPAELQEQSVFYEERSAGLGKRFAAQVETAVSLAVAPFKRKPAYRRHRK